MTGPETQDRLRAWARAQAGSAPPPPSPARPASGPPRPALGPDITPRLLHEISEHDDGVPGLDIATAPDGTPLLATGSHDGTIRIWDLVTGERRLRLDNHGQMVIAVRFLPAADGTFWLASAGHGDGLKIWDLRSGELRHRDHAGGDGHRVDAARTSDGRAVVATLSSDSVTRVWDAATGTCLCELPGSGESSNNGSGVGLLALGDGGLLVASTLGDGSLRIWDGQTGQPKHHIVPTSAQPGRLQEVCFAPAAGTRPPLVVAGSNDGAARTWDAATGESQRTLGDAAGIVMAVACLVLADDRRIVATADAGGTVRLWDADTGACLHTLTVEEADSTSRLWDVALRGLDDGTVLLAVGASSGRVWVYTLAGEPAVAVPGPAPPAPGPWTITERPGLPDLTGHTGPVYCLAAIVLDDGTALLASGSRDLTVRIWDLRSGAARHAIETPVSSVWSLALAAGPGPGGMVFLATASGNAEGVLLWDPLTGRPRPQPEALRGPRVYAVAARTAADGRLVLASVGGVSDDSPGYRALAWDAATGQAEHGLNSPSEIFAVALAERADGSLLVVTEGPGHRVVVSGFTLADGDDTRPDDRPSEPVVSIATAEFPDGSIRIAAGFRDGQVRLWDPATRQPWPAIACGGRLSAVRLARVSGGAWLLATMTSTQVALWDPDTGEQLWTRTDPDIRAPEWTTSDPLAVADTGDAVRVAYAVGNAIRVVSLDVHRPPPPGPAVPAAVDRVAWAAAVAGLPVLAEAGIEAPLGLLAGLVELTGGGAAPPGLAPLAGSPGVARLRSLGWPAASRVALAALLLGGVPAEDRFAAPAVPAGELYAALREALAGPVPRGEPFVTPVAALTAAGEAVTAATMALLGLLGPAAAAADPVLPLRLRRFEEVLPVLDPAAVASLSDLPRQVAGALAERAYSARTAAGTVGLHRHGSPASLVRSQLALPDDLLTLRLVSGDLLYRLHEGEPEPRLEPVTIVLDTTPPTFGPVEAVLRLAAHTMAAVLLAAGIEAALVVLDSPGQAEVIRRPGDLMRVWATRTLQPPALAPALATAAAVGHPVVAVLTTHHLARSYPLTASPSLRVLTTHAPGEAPRVTAGPYRAHVPPGAAPADLAAAVARVLSRHDR